MTEIFNSICEVVKRKISNPLLGTFSAFWMIFHWKIFVILFFVSEDKIQAHSLMLKSDYLYNHITNYNSIEFWISWLMPFVMTWLTIWVLPKRVFIPAFEKEEDYRIAKKMMRIKKEKMLKEAEIELEEKKIEKLEKVVLKTEEEKKVEKADPKISWNYDFKTFCDTKFYNELNRVIDSVYNNYGRSEGISVATLAYYNANNLINYDKSSKKIELTDKGKYFVSLYLDNNKN